MVQSYLDRQLLWWRRGIVFYTLWVIHYITQVCIVQVGCLESDLVLYSVTTAPQILIDSLRWKAPILVAFML